jgi:phosphate transport system substrate-binding protein
MQHKATFSVIFKSLVSLAIAPVLFSAVLLVARYDKTFAQSPAPSQTFPLPSSLPSGTTVKLDGSSSLTGTNNDLKKRFEEKFPGSVISLSSNGTDAALQALQKGEIDLAAIGRLLTDEEKAQGLMEAPISREKIAIIVSPANPFKGSITDDQFVRIFRGEIKNWSELGGPDVPIRVIDRPASSDTRQALSRYPGFNSGPLQTGANATQVAQDDTPTVIRELGADGISYAIVDQVVNQPDVVTLPMHDIPPTDPRYPYSQPRNYVYKGQPNPAIVAFLGFATTTLGQDTSQPPANPQGSAAVPASPAASTPGAVPPMTNPAPTAAPTTAATPEQEGGFDLSSLWWLLIPLLGIPLLFWLLKGRGAAAPGVVAATQSGRMILVARNCRDAYAYWEVPTETFEEVRRQGGRDLKVRLHDVTDVPGLDGQTPHKVQEFSCRENAQDLHIPVDVDDRTYAAELGYVTDTGEWLRIAHSDPVHVPACVPGDSGVGTAATGAATAAAGGVIAGGVAAAARSDSQPGTPAVIPPVPAEPRRTELKRIVMVPRSNEDAYVYWDVPDAEKAALRAQGGRQLMLRVHDVTGRDLERQAAHSMREYECDETAWDKHIPLETTDLAGSDVPGRDYVTELGYVTDDNRWLSLVRSDVVHVQDGTKSVTAPASGVMDNASSAIGDATRSITSRLDDAPAAASDAIKAAGATLAGGAAAVAGASAVTQAFFDRSQTTGRVEPSQPAQDYRITLEPRGAGQAYVSWDVAEAYKQALRDRGGRQLTLQIHDATNIDIDYHRPHSTQTYVCNETDQEKYVTIPAADRDYVADLGYFTDDNRWLRLARSMHIHVPANP